MRTSSSVLSWVARRWAPLFLLLECVFFAVLGSGFATLNGVQIVLFYGTSLALLATAETFVVAAGGIDLSVGFVMGFASIVSAKLVAAFAAAGCPDAVSLALAVVATLAIGLGPGCVNGLLVARLRVPPFLATFSTLGIAYGISLLLTGGAAAKDVPPLANVIGNGYLLYWVAGGGLHALARPEVPRGTVVVEIVPTMVVVTTVVVAISAFVLARTRFGRHVYAIGGNVDAANRAGIDTRGRLVAVYALSSLHASLAGVIYMLQYVTGKADAGAPFLLDAIVAVVIGGASLFGGSGSVWRSILGCLILSVLETGLRMMGVPTFDKFIAVGVILILAVLVDQAFPDLGYKES